MAVGALLASATRRGDKRRSYKAWHMAVAATSAAPTRSGTWLSRRQAPLVQDLAHGCRGDKRRSYKAWHTAVGALLASATRRGDKRRSYKAWHTAVGALLASATGRGDMRRSYRPMQVNRVH